MRRDRQKGSPPKKQKSPPKPRSARQIPAERLIRPEDRVKRVSGDPARELILDLWGRTRMDWGFASTRLAETLRTQKRLPGPERRRVAETLFGMIRDFRRLDLALSSSRLAAGRERELGRYLAYRLLAREITVEAARAELPHVDWASVLTVDERVAGPRDAARHLGEKHSYPDWLAARFLKEYGDEAHALASALNQRPPLTIRANILKITREALAQALLGEGVETEPTRWSEAGLTVVGRPNLWSTQAFHDGLFEVQDEGSQLIAELVLAPPKGIVVDACAGAGGKTLAVGAAMQSKGRLIAVDVDGRKLEDLKKRCRRAGLSSVQAVVTPEHAWPTEVAELTSRVDRVLVDAPCDGLGSLRRNPEIRWRLQEDDPPRFSAYEEAIARRAISLLAPGGRIIYATCTLLRDENEAVVERLLATEPVELVRVAELWGNERAAPLTDASGTFLKLAPHKHGTDGFFAAVLRKRR